MLLNQVRTAPRIIPRLPERLAPLSRLASNLAWSWMPEIAGALERLEAPGSRGPVEALWLATNLDRLAEDESYLREVEGAEARLQEYLAGSTDREGLVAYFCAEFGLHESLPLYSGGLGILAGDHLKEASDQGLSLVGVGLFYRRGFFFQMIDQQGRQEHEYPRLEPERTPVERVLRPGSEDPLTIEVELPGRAVKVAVWRVAVGRVPLLLLDTDLPDNSPEDRPITSQLYTSGRDMRLHQEVVLGVGGVRALEALGIEPTVWHLNEGHSALLLLERLRRGETREAVKGSSILTIHTPVAAGNERFDAKHAAAVLAPLVAGSSLKMPEVLKLAQDSVGDSKVFDLTAFALRLCRAANGVSVLHGKTADKTWRRVAGFPLIAVTNGVHMPTWLGPQMKALDPEAASDEELWQAHAEQKQALLEFARRRLTVQAARHGAGPSELASLLGALDPDAFTIGFARRFAAYKRAMLLFSDEKRLAKLLNNRLQPVQILFAGKAHPADREGQKLIEQVWKKTESPKWRGKVFLLEDYDMEAGRMLVQGTDIWLNNPRRPLEASGTSGMKAAANGVPNVSVLDGWWDEAFHTRPRNGFAIGGRRTLRDQKAQDRADAEALYQVLEDEVLPLYHLRSEWVRVMRASIVSSLHQFSTERMLDDYTRLMYNG